MRHGVLIGHGNCLRRAAEKTYVTGQTQVGIRDVSSTARDGYEAALVYVTIDIHGFCPSIAPGTDTPSHGGFLYCEVHEIPQALAKRYEMVGMDMVEVASDYDQTGNAYSANLLNFRASPFKGGQST